MSMWFRVGIDKRHGIGWTVPIWLPLTSASWLPEEAVDEPSAYRAKGRSRGKSSCPVLITSNIQGPCPPKIHREHRDDPCLEWSDSVPTERQVGQETHSPFSLQTALCRKMPPTHTVPRRPTHIASCSVGTGILISASSHSSPNPGLPARSFQLSDHHYVFLALYASVVLKILLIFYSLGNQHSERLCI